MLVRHLGIWPVGWLLCMAAAAPADVDATKPADPETLTELRRAVDRPGERVCMLDNGLTVILKEHRSAPVVAVRMYCQTGSIYEQEYLGSGMSHLFEHLLHGSATTTRSEEESRRVLGDIGGNTNAYTTFDHTCYYINTGREHLERAVHLLGDWITRPTFPQEAFDREWGVVQRELERDVDDADHQLFYMTMETMYLASPARFPVIGYKPVVQSLTKADIVGYHQRMYVPDNIVVCIAGDMDLDEATKVVCKAFASFKRKRLPTIVLADEPEAATPRSATRRMKVQAAVLRLAWPSIPLTHPDLYALDVLSYVLTQGDSSRLVRTVRDQGLVYTIESSSWTPHWVKGMFEITSRLEPAKIADATRAILTQIEQVKTDLISEEELDQAKRQKAAEHVFGMQTAEDVASNLASDYLATGDIDFSKAYVANIQKVTREQIREVAQRYLAAQRQATITVLPEHFAPPGQGAAEVVAPQPVRKITLPNGLRCLIRRDPTTPLVAMQSFSLGGVLMEDDRTNGLSRLAATLAPRGTATRTAQDIARFFDARGATIDGASGLNSIYFRAQTLKSDFAEALAVFADVICHPSFPTSELEIYRPQQLDQIARINEQWRSETLAYFQTKMFKQSPYRRLAIGSADVVGSATREDIERFYRACVVGPNTVVAIFGDVDVAEAESLLRKHFADLPSEATPLPTVTAETPPDQPALYVKQKPASRGTAGICLGFPGAQVSNQRDMIHLAVLDTIISGYRYPTGWLHENLRGGNRSLVYEVHAVNQAGVVPGVFQIYAACQPDKINEVYQIITDQLSRARAGRFTEQELERAKKIILATELMEMQSNADRAMQASLDELYGLGYDYRAQFGGLVEAVSMADVTQIAKRYLAANPVIAVVTPAVEEVKLGFSAQAVDAEPEEGAGR